MVGHTTLTVLVSDSRPLGAVDCSKFSPCRYGESDMKTLLKKLVREEKGQDVIEYALLAAGISIIVIPTVPLIGTAVNGVYVRINGAVAGI